MKLTFSLEVVTIGRKASLYTIRLPGMVNSELDDFLLQDDVQNNPDFQNMVFRLQSGPEKYGWRNAWFRDERGVKALFAPYPEQEKRDVRFPPQLRLYCLRYPGIVVAGNGGVKRTRTFQEDHFLDQCVRTLENVAKRMDRRMRLRGLLISHDDSAGPLFIGNTEFGDNND